MAEIVDQECVDHLLDAAERGAPQLEYPLIKSMSKLRNRGPELVFDRARVEQALRKTAGEHYQLLQAIHLYVTDRRRADTLLLKALREKQQQHVKRIFRFLGLTFAAKDMYNAYLGYVSSDRETRASALEFLENVVDRDTKSLLMPFLDPPSTPEAIAAGERLFGGRLANRDEALQALLHSRDPWLRACAALSTADAAPPGSAPLVQQMRRDIDPVVRETAELVLRER